MSHDSFEVFFNFTQPTFHTQFESFLLMPYKRFTLITLNEADAEFLL